jgi:hypothetical protein
MIAGVVLVCVVLFEVGSAISNSSMFVQTCKNDPIAAEDWPGSGRIQINVCPGLDHQYHFHSDSMPEATVLHKNEVDLALASVRMECDDVLDLAIDAIDILMCPTGEVIPMIDPDKIPGRILRYEWAIIVRETDQTERFQAGVPIALTPAFIEQWPKPL